MSLLSSRPEVAALPEALERFGIATLGELAALSRAHLADRFGPAGPLARDLARGKDAPLRPRVPSERLEEVLELPESASGPQLERALGMLIDRVLARHERRGRTVRAVVLSAKLVGGGTWRTQMTFREALADPRRMRLAITGRLTELPAPADSLRLRVEAFGPPSGDQRSLLAEPATIRRARLREAVRQTRAAAGPGRRPAHPRRRPRLARARTPPRARAMGAVTRRARHIPRARPPAGPPTRPRRPAASVRDVAATAARPDRPPAAARGPRRSEATPRRRVRTGAPPPAPRRHLGARRASAGIEPIASRGPRRLAKPKAVRVKADDAGRPQLIGKREVDAVRESWLVEDRWWTDEPLRGATGRW